MSDRPPREAPDVSLIIPPLGDEPFEMNVIVLVKQSSRRLVWASGLSAKRMMKEIRMLIPGIEIGPESEDWEILSSEAKR